MKLSTLALAATLVAGIALAGCGSSSSKDNAATPAPAAQEQAPNIKDGVTRMLAVSDDLKAAIQAGDEAKVKATAPKLEDSWSSFEDAVKPKYPDLYEEVEKSLDPTLAGAQVSPLDKDLLNKTNDALNASLKKLANQVK